MSDLAPPPTDLAPKTASWPATEAHPLPSASGGYIPVDHGRLLSAAAPGVIQPVLVLPTANDPGK